MEKVFEMGKTSAVGSFRLFIGVAISTVIMSIGTVILTRVLSANDYGLYTLAMSPTIMMILFRDWGVNSAITKQVASLRAAGKEDETCDVMLSGISFEVVTGVALSVLCFVLAGPFATLLGRPGISPYISVMSATILAGSLLISAQSSFVGYERMGLHSFTVICQALAKTAVAPVLVLLGYGVFGAVVGYTFSFIAGGTIGITALYILVYRPISKKRTRTVQRSTVETLRPMLGYGVPLSISTIIYGLLAQFYVFTMAIFIPNSVEGNSVIGNYNAALNFAVLLTFLTVPISTVLFPVFAKLNPQSERELVKSVFAASVKYASILLIPATMMVMALSMPIVNTLFGEKYAYAPLFLTLYVINALYAAAGSLSLNSFLSGLGETKMMMMQAFMTAPIGLTLALVSIPLFQNTLGPAGPVFGVILAINLATVPAITWGLHWINKRFGAKADFKSSAKILAASTLAAALSFLTTIVLHDPLTQLTTRTTFQALIQLTIGTTVFLAAYVISAPLIGAVTQSDITSLRTLLAGLGSIAKIANIPMDAAEKILQIKNHRKSQNAHMS